MQKKNPVWEFLASVKLALIVFFVLAISSIIGTIIPQKEAPARYIELYGDNVAKIFQMLDIPDMYASWWFISFLILFSINLTVCTIERFPHIWKIVTQDGLATEPDRVKKMSMRREFSAGVAYEKAITAVDGILSAAGWSAQKADREGGALYFSQKGAWTRLGVIVVHVSILVIFVGSLIGTFFGYKASVMIPEGSSTDKIYQSNQEHTPIPLGFTVYCDAFYLHYYDTGAPKEFLSDLRVVKDGQEVLQQRIEVNGPMQYGGLTFYQSSYQGIDGQFAASISNETTGASQHFILTPRREMKWSEENVTFGIVDFEGPDWQRRYRYKIWFSDGKGNPSQFWMTEGTEVKIQRPDTTYVFMAKPRFATGLQVVKDPGVWTVYIGCGLMIAGLIVIFFMSHRRIWVFVEQDGEKSAIYISGLSNKNKVGFQNNFDALAEQFEENEILNMAKESA